MATKPSSFRDFLAGVPADQRTALEKIRKAIQAAAPEAEEGISYGVPAFLLNGKAIAGFAAAANHCSYFPMSGHVIAALAAELKNYETSKGAIRFPANKPLPAALVRKLVKARIAELAPAKPRAAKPSAEKQTAAGARPDPAVAAYLRELKHPLKKEIEAVRQIILGVSPQISEGIKWNSPSFRTKEWFATLNLRAQDGKERVWLILHLGAKVKDKAKPVKIADPAGLLKWLGKDRALATFTDAKDVQAKRSALQAILREWIRYV